MTRRKYFFKIGKSHEIMIAPTLVFATETMLEMGEFAFGWFNLRAGIVRSSFTL